MKTSENGKNMIKRYEGLRLTSYKAHKSEIFYTIGYGHYGADVGMGAVITRERANELFDKDIVKYENAVNELYEKRHEYCNCRLAECVVACYT